jgi:hypothetical protein
MKRGVMGHPKLRHLARLLDVPPYAALGLLEALLHWAHSYAPEGDVGRHADQDIADGVGWDGDASTLVGALVTARWLDRCGTHRLVIHDLADHADRVWQQTLHRKGAQFVTATPPPDDTVKPRRGSVKPHSVTENPPRDTLKPPSYPNQTRPDQTRPEDTLSRARARGTVTAAYPEDFVAFWDAYPRKAGKPEALKAWRRVGSPAALAAIQAALAWQRRDPEWLREAGRFIPHPTTYLNQRRWEDEPPARASAFTTPATAGNAAALAGALARLAEEA